MASNDDDDLQAELAATNAHVARLKQELRASSLLVPLTSSEVEDLALYLRYAYCQMVDTLASWEAEPDSATKRAAIVVCEDHVTSIEAIRAKLRLDGYDTPWNIREAQMKAETDV